MALILTVFLKVVVSRFWTWTSFLSDLWFKQKLTFRFGLPIILHFKWILGQMLKSGKVAIKYNPTHSNWFYFDLIFVIFLKRPWPALTSLNPLTASSDFPKVLCDRISTSILHNAKFCVKTPATFTYGNFWSYTLKYYTVPRLRYYYLR